MIINLSLEEQTKALRIAEQPSVKGEAWLFDPTHKAENIGNVELSGEVKFPPSIHHFIHHQIEAQNET